ncbi:type IV pilus assembly protein PilF [Bisgaardia hudsonensis]|uniref:Type IV pilus assembly protein PilF n=1 Tax=Bisgaardia hudsonensis TaxID=109472 RepID=A0A4R2N2V1_9PAST|nr:type IV pilus biogenesis/stability protein PilW [Bisgaardia hudsonensis]TCP14191.1 type IV pilus assembly protein PilF [Bisgaardia hudsonensis]
MRYIKWISAIYFSFLLSACVSNTQSNNSFNKESAAKARVELALGYLSFHNFTQAKASLDKALNYAPNYFLVHSAFAYFYQLQGNIVEARKSYESSIELDDKKGDVKNNYGAFLCGQGEFDLAFQQFDNALKTDGYHNQIDTYENIILCAKAANNLNRYNEYLILLKKVAPERVHRLSK